MHVASGICRSYPMNGQLCHCVLCVCDDDDVPYNTARHRSFDTHRQFNCRCSRPAASAARFVHISTFIRDLPLHIYYLLFFLFGRMQQKVSSVWSFLRNNASSIFFFVVAVVVVVVVAAVIVVHKGI